MTELLVIHGTCHGAWCFDHLLAELERRGIPARAIDLPGRDGSPTSLDDYAQAILAAAAPDTILVGHSAGGYAITAAAEAAPDRFRGLIYLCAYLPAAGQSLADLRRAGGLPAPDGRAPGPGLPPHLALWSFALPVDAWQAG